jgi:hypothetical protein
VQYTDFNYGSKKNIEMLPRGKEGVEKEGGEVHRTLGVAPEQKTAGEWLKLQPEIVLLSNHPADSKTWSSRYFPSNLLIELILRRFCLKMIFIGILVAYKKSDPIRYGKKAGPGVARSPPSGR